MDSGLRRNDEVVGDTLLMALLPYITPDPRSLQDSVIGPKIVYDQSVSSDAQGETQYAPDRSSLRAGLRPSTYICRQVTPIS